MGGRDPVTRAGVHQQEAGIRARDRWDLNPGTVDLTATQMPALGSVLVTLFEVPATENPDPQAAVRTDPPRILSYGLRAVCSRLWADKRLYTS